MGHPIDPGSQRAASVELPQAPPQCHVNLLNEIKPAVRVRLVSIGEPFQRGAKFPGRLLVVFIRIVEPRPFLPAFSHA